MVDATQVHIPVLLDEVIQQLAPRPGGVYIDATCGLGGHSEAMLEASSPDGRVMSIDRDPDALERARARLSPFGARSQVVEGDFSDVLELGRTHGYHPADGVLADLGMSSLQLDTGDRGFSFRAKAPLDMRMGPRVGATARELLDTVDEVSLADLLRKYGEVPRAGRVARAILQARDEGALQTTTDLVRAVERVLKKRGRTHPATQVFQAIRIAVNRELDELERLLDVLPSVLRPGGRVAIISFHSLEDRMVKKRFRDPPAPVMPHGLPVEPERPRGPFEPVSRRATVATEDETARNPRARSAKLRVAELRVASEGS